MKTSNKTYQIKCKSNLDRNVWIKSLIHFINLARESSKIIEINRKISQIKNDQFKLETRNTIFEKEIIQEDRERMFKSFELLREKHYEFFKHDNSDRIANFFQNMGMIEI